MGPLSHQTQDMIGDTAPIPLGYLICHASRGECSREKESRGNSEGWPTFAACPEVAGACEVDSVWTCIALGATRRDNNGRYQSDSGRLF